MSLENLYESTTQSGPDVGLIYANQLRETAERKQAERIARGTEKQFLLRLDPDNKYWLDQVPSGEKTTKINAALREYFQQDDVSRHKPVFVAGSGVFNYNWIEHHMKKEPDIFAEVQDNATALNRQQFVDEFMELYERRYQVPWVITYKMTS